MANQLCGAKYVNSFYIKSAGMKLRFHALPGDGVPLVFLHGLGSASSCDFPQIAADPALAGRPMLLVDLLGSGFSDRMDSFSYSIRDQAETIVALIQSLDGQTIDLFGHSMGGAIAIEVASLTDRVRTLVLGEPVLDSGGGVYSRSVAAASEADFVTWGFDALLQSSRAKGDELWAATLLNSAPYAVHREAVSLIAGEWRQKLYELSQPRTVLFGALSGLENEARLLETKGIATAIVADAGHSMTWDNPSAVAQLIGQAIPSNF
jgi:pimeloyl-ACP methyl ester carboxylesterase